MQHLLLSVYRVFCSIWNDYAFAFNLYQLNLWYWWYGWVTVLYRSSPQCKTHTSIRSNHISNIVDPTWSLCFSFFYFFQNCLLKKKMYFFIEFVSVHKRDQWCILDNAKTLWQCACMCIWNENVLRMHTKYWNCCARFNEAVHYESFVQISLCRFLRILISSSVLHEEMFCEEISLLETALRWKIENNKIIMTTEI